MTDRSRRGREREAPAGSSGAPWTIRFSPRLLSEDYHAVGHAAFEIARTAIHKKLKVDPEGYGTTLRSPLQGLYKLKASHVRVVYHIEDGTREVWVLLIGARRDIWDEDQGDILERLDSQRAADRARDATPKAAGKATGKATAKKRPPRR